MSKVSDATLQLQCGLLSAPAARYMTLLVRAPTFQGTAGKEFAPPFASKHPHGSQERVLTEDDNLPIRIE